MVVDVVSHDKLGKRLTRMRQNTILLLTDDSADVQALLQTLEQSGLQWLITATGADGIATAAQTLPDVMLVAQNLPDMTGVEVCRQVKQHALLHEIPIIFVAPPEYESETLDGLAAGASDYLPTPIQPTVALMRIQMQLQLRQMRQEIQAQDSRMRREWEEHQQAVTQLTQLQKAFETMQLGLTITDLDGTILYVNPAEAEMHGYHVAELLGRNIRLFSPTEYLKPRTLRHIQGWKGLVRESMNLRKDGSQFPVWLMSEIVQNADGEPTAIVTSCEDITERKAIEAERERYRTQLEDLVQERTVELTETNTQLRQEILKHQQTMALLEQRNRELALLNHVSQLFSSSIELDQVLESVLHEMHRLLKIEATSFWLRTPHSEELVCRQATGPGRETVIGWRLTYGQGTVGQAAQAGNPVLIADTRNDPAHYKGVDQKTGIELRSILSLPVRVKGEIIGVLSLVDTHPNRFTNDDLRLIEPIATAAASAVENARLYAQANQEIIERTLAEKALKELEHIVNQSPVIVFLWKAEEHWPVEFVSENIQQFGYTPGDFYTQRLRFTDILVPEDVERVVEEVQQHSKQPDSPEFRQEYRVLTNTGAVRWVEDLTWIRRNPAGRITHYQGIIIDITERKQSEAALRQAKEAAENANRAKSEFLANMSHEIRTPMNAVLGFTDLLIEQVTDPLQKSYLEAIKAGGTNLLMLINDILDLSKIEAGKMEIHPKPVSLRQIFQELRQIFQVKLNEKRLEWLTELTPDIPEQILLDEIRLRQMLFNLIGNAIKFTDQGYVRLAAEATKASQGDQRINLTLIVEDSGIGIPAQQQDLIFEAFRQQDGQDSRKYGGTGLGLTITKRLVEVMQGTIHIESQVETGSRFIIQLPDIPLVSAQPPASSQTPQENRPEIDFLAGIVLIVDDVPHNRMLVREYLRNSNLTVIEAENGEQAVRLTQ